jgi:hypothetical protein
MTNLYQAAKAALEALTCGPDDGFDPGHRCSHCDDYVDRNGPVRKMLRLALAQTSEDAHLDAEWYRRIRKSIQTGSVKTMPPLYIVKHFYTNFGSAKFGNSVGIVLDGLAPTSLCLVINGRYFSIYRSTRSGKLKRSSWSNSWRKQNISCC